MNRDKEGENIFNLAKDFLLPDGNHRNFETLKAHPGFEPGTSRNQSKNHAARPKSHIFI